MRKLKPCGFLFLASLMMTAQGGAWAEDRALPEVQVDGSVLQGLAIAPPANEAAGDLAPVHLTPPSSLNRIAGPSSASLTAIETGEEDLPLRKTIKPVITTTEAPPAKKLLRPSRKPEVAEPVLFPVKMKSTNVGELNPAERSTAIDAPVKPDALTSQALARTMMQRDSRPQPLAPATPVILAPAPVKNLAQAEWRQADPEILYENIPVPRVHPAKGMASAAFVQQARKNLVDSYTIVKREGDSMPAVPKTRVVGEKLPAPRLSVADIAGDPLASRIVDMTPEEVAEALNNMAPASGREQAHLQREIAAVAKPRIVRERGEWIRKKHKAQEEIVAETAVAAEPAASPVAEESLLHKTALPLPRQTPAAKLPAQTDASPAVQPQGDWREGKIAVAFTPGEISLNDEATGLIDKNIVGTLKNDPEARIQIIAWATATDGKEGTARRTSLSRALSVRSYLISQEIDATRMDVRAMGVSTDKQGEADKVDMILIGGKKS